MSVIRGWQHGEQERGREGGNARFSHPGKRGPCGGEVPQHHFSREPYFSLEGRDGRLRGGVCLCSLIVLPTLLAFKVHQRFSRFWRYNTDNSHRNLRPESK